MTAFWIVTGGLVVSIVASAIVCRRLAREGEHMPMVDEAHDP